PMIRMVEMSVRFGIRSSWRAYSTARRAILFRAHKKRPRRGAPGRDASFMRSAGRSGAAPGPDEWACRQTKIQPMGRAEGLSPMDCSELVADPGADLGQPRVDVGAKRGVGDMLNAGDDVPVLGKLISKAARFPEGQRATHIDAPTLRPVRGVVDGAAEFALEEELANDRNAPVETGEGVAAPAAGVDHRADVEARLEKPRYPGIPSD